MASGAGIPRRQFLPARLHIPVCLSFLCLALSVPADAVAQADPPKAAAAKSDGSPTEPVIKPLEPADLPVDSGVSTTLHGFNAGLTLSGVHDSVTGWASLANPSFGYSFNDIFSVEATVPIYFYRLAETLATKPKPDAELVPLRAEVGDMVLLFHAQFLPRLFSYQATGAVSAPSGDETYGLTTGRVTFDLDNHFERSFRRITPSVSLGAGDSSTLVNRLVTRNYTSLGPLAHFQAGIGLDLFRGVFFESDAYEQLPMGDQKIYGPSRKGGPTVVIGHHVSEDNGFTNSIDVPLDGHTTLSAYYNRSLRLHSDTVGFSVTYVLRAPPVVDENTMDDLFR